MIHFVILALSTISTAHGEEKSVSPYIDALKRQMPTREAETPGSYTEQQKARLQNQEPEEDAVESTNYEGYTDRMKKVLPPPKFEEKPQYTEDMKKQLGPATTGGAIQAVREGRSALKMKRPGEITQAFGFRMGAAMSYDITTDPGFGTVRTFDGVYGGGFAPDFTFFYEWHPFHSEWLGNVALVASAGASYFTGVGSFAFVPNGFTSTESRTTLSFGVIPISLTASYKFNLLRWVRPYISAGPVLVNYVESRNDAGKSKFGYSTGLLYSGGVSILLDFFSDEAWDLYDQWRVKHFYLTVDYSRMAPITGGVNFKNSGFTAGLTFEY